MDSLLTEPTQKTPPTVLVGHLIDPIVTQNSSPKKTEAMISENLWQRCSPHHKMVSTASDTSIRTGLGNQIATRLALVGFKWSLFLYPFSTLEVQSIFGLNATRSLQRHIRSLHVFGSPHPHDHLNRHVFLSACDTVELLYDGPLDASRALDTLFCFCPEDAEAFLSYEISEHSEIVDAVLVDQTAENKGSCALNDAIMFVALCQSVFFRLHSYLCDLIENRQPLGQHQRTRSSELTSVFGNSERE